MAKPTAMSRVFTGTERMIVLAEKISKRKPREAIAMSLLAAAVLSRVFGLSEDDFRSGVELAWKTSEK